MAERLDAFMARANAAYYASHDPFADFTTAPEISQVFGELLGLWAGIAWQGMGAPDRFLLAEAGPGRGSLMADALRALAQALPACRAAAAVALIETSPRLRAAQAARLAGAAWYDDLGALPVGPCVLLANEFLDALPIRQFLRQGDGWQERFVQDGRFLTRPAPAPDHPAAADAAEGAIIEIGAAAQDFVRALARRLCRQGGAALLIDYGPEFSAAGDSLQALRDGAPADPLADPGGADLTAHVDFAALARVGAAAGARIVGPVPQGKFLAALGLFQRSERLARSQAPRRAMALLDAANRLAEPDRMGRLFKVLAVCHPAMPPLPGFEP